MGLSQEEYWSELSFPPPGDLPNPGTEFMFPALAGRFFITEPPGNPQKKGIYEGKIKSFSSLNINILRDTLISNIQYFVQNTNNNNVFGDYSLWISEMNNSSIERDRVEKLRILCYKVSALPMK